MWLHLQSILIKAIHASPAVRRGAPQLAVTPLPNHKNSNLSQTIILTIMALISPTKQKTRRSAQCKPPLGTFEPKPLSLIHI